MDKSWCEIFLVMIAIIVLVKIIRGRIK